MKRIRNLRSLLILVGLAAFLIGIPVWLTSSRSRQEGLDNDLILAARLGDVADVKSLLNQGADPNARDKPDAPPMNLWRWLASLLAAGRRSPAPQGPTALRCAADSKHAYAIVKLLLEKGADVKVDDAGEDPALFWVARSGDQATVELLLEHGADVNAQPTVGFPVLEGAILSGNIDLVKMLLTRGAAVNALSHPTGDTPLSIAQSLNRPDVIALLKKAGAK